MDRTVRYLLIAAGVAIVASGAFVVKKKILLPRGIRNNNPGNLRDTTIAWQGEVAPNMKKDKDFEEFTEMKFGVRALLMDLRSDIQKGKNTLHSLLAEFAPGNENDTSAYIRFMVDQTPYVEYQTLKPEKEYLWELARGIIRYETGRDILTRELFETAYSMM
jgi:hypothetical protein